MSSSFFLLPFFLSSLLSPPTALLSKFSHTPLLSNQISALCFDGKEQTHNYRLQLFKYCDMWSLTGTKSACNERLGHKDWENRELISVACPHLSTQTHTIVFIVHSATLYAVQLSLHCGKCLHIQKLNTNKPPLLSPLYHPYSCKEIEEKHYLHKPCVE